jgi:hypothetical protein
MIIGCGILLWWIAMALPRLSILEQFFGVVAGGLLAVGGIVLLVL